MKLRPSRPSVNSLDLVGRSMTTIRGSLLAYPISVRAFGRYVSEAPNASASMRGVRPDFWSHLWSPGEKPREETGSERQKCIDPSVSAQVRLLIGRLALAFSCQALGEVCGYCRSGSNLQLFVLHAEGFRSDAGGCIAPSASE